MAARVPILDLAARDELKDVLKENLENRGVLGQIKARIRAEVFNALDDQTEDKPILSNENMLINELIREYLEFNKYKYTSSVLMTESGQPQQPLDPQFLAKELGIGEDHRTATVPLLYGMLTHFLRKHHHGNEPRSAEEIKRSDDIYSRHSNGTSSDDHDHQIFNPGSISLHKK